MTMEEHARREGDVETVKAERKLAYDYFNPRPQAPSPARSPRSTIWQRCSEEDGQKERARNSSTRRCKARSSSICPVSREDAENLRDKIEERDALTAPFFEYRNGGLE